MLSQRKSALYAALGALFVGGCFLGGYLLIGHGQGGQNSPPNVAGAPATSAPYVEQEVYKSDFTQAPGPEWNIPRIGHTKAGQRPNLGPFFPKDSPSLSLANLPPHRMLRASFDLYLTESWDGSSPQWGPSMFDLSLDDERSLIHTTFCNCGFFRDNNEQAFPDNYPALPYPGFTMAAEKQTLGSKHDFGGGPSRIIDCSSVYHLVLTFPHDQPQVTFNFQTNIRDGDYKGYGIADMRVETLPQVAQMTAAQLAGAWKDLGSGEPEVQWKARWDLIAAGDASVDFISEHRSDRIEMTADQMQALAAKMGEHGSPTAMSAYYQLRVMGPAALPVMRPSIASINDDFVNLTPSQFDRYPNDATDIRLARAKVVLEAIHTDKARSLMRALAL